MKQFGFSRMQNNKKRLNCSSGVTAERFVNTLNFIDPDDYSAYDDLDGMCEAIGYGPDDVGGWGQWFNTLDAAQKREAWNYVSWAEEEEEDDLDSSKAGSCMWRMKTNSSSRFEDRVFDEAENVIERIDKLMYSLRDAKREMIQDMESGTARGAQEAIWNMQMNMTSVQAHMKRLENAVEAASETASMNSSRRR